MFERMKANHRYKRFIVTLCFCEHLCDYFDSMCLPIEERFIRCNQLYWGYRLSKFYNKESLHYSTKKYLQKGGKMITLKNGRKKLFQWDIGQIIVLTDERGGIIWPATLAEEIT